MAESCGTLRGIVVGESDVFDPLEYAAYRELGQPSVRLYDGVALWSGATSEVLEGSRTWQRQVGIIFDSLAAAHVWLDSPEYQHAREQRLKGARSSVWTVEQTGEPQHVGIAPAGSATPLAYMLGDVTEIRDSGRFKEYLAGVAPSLAAVGARDLTRGGHIDLIEGPWQPSRAVLIEFPGWDVALAWYRSDAYQPLARLRQSCCDTELVLLDGVPPTPAPA